MPERADQPTPDRTGAKGGHREMPVPIDAVLHRDRVAFERRLRGLARAERQGKPNARALKAIEADMRRSAEIMQRRRASVPAIQYTADLPVAQRREELVSVIGSRQVAIVCGETGSGKTTQLPKICLELGRGVGATIGHTQPRRIAARSVAARIAEELDAPGVVATKMRFDDRTDDRTLIKVMTDGILLAETRSDPLLRQYDTIIIDEAHERSLNIDFLLGFLKRLLPRRPDLKLVITSATIDAGRFADHFADADGPAPIIEISGRTFPVEVRHATRPEELPPEEAAAEAAVSLIREQRSDVLVFMPGEREIRQTAHALRHHPGLPPHAEIIPLYARLSPAEQQRAFRPSGNPRVVISTNVAETSITVPNIRSVVDPGTARIKRYSARARIDQLLIEPISQASANQRAGRCGRVAPGVCVRLYEEKDFAAREPFTAPELLRSDLAGVILQMIDLGLGDPLEFPFLDAPVRSRWRDGYSTLVELGAIDEGQQLTDLGKRMGALPVDPRIARMILAGQENGCLRDVLIIASALSVQDPRVRPHEKRDAADQAHAEFRVPGSDFLTLRAIWDFYHEELRATSRRKAGRACEKRFLSVRRIDEWREVYRQVSRLCREMGYPVSSGQSVSDDVHRSILTGLLANIGHKGDQRVYRGTRNTSFELAPGSACSESRPRWVMAGEVVRTHRVLARTVASIKPEWVERAAAHLIRRTHSDPRWDAESRRVVAEEKVVFEGLEIVPKRTVHYGPIDPAESRRIFIHHALVEGDMRTASVGVRSNRDLERKARTLQAKARRSDFLADAQAVFDFYDQRIPPDVFTARAFERWVLRAEADEPGVLRMRERDLVHERPEEITPAAYPDNSEVFGSRLRIRYELSPGEDADGATIRVTMQELHRISPEQAEWIVPGFVPGRVRALVRTMP
ncbi:MAG: ATP-dependent RNA helicase HrpA, partial [Planctomycetota bacterium]